jgi:hypothetical protein
MANVIESKRGSSSVQHGLMVCATSDAVGSGVGNEGVVGSGDRAGVGAEATLGDASAGLSVSGPVEQPVMTANVTRRAASVRIISTPSGRPEVTLCVTERV